MVSGACALVRMVTYRHPGVQKVAVVADSRVVGVVTDIRREVPAHRATVAAAGRVAYRVACLEWAKTMSVEGMAERSPTD